MDNIRLIAMDLDGTLLQRDGTLLPSAVQALKRARERGITVAIASGRYPENAALVFLDNGLDGPVIGINGASVTDRAMGDCLFLHVMKDDTARMTREILDKCGVDYLLFSHKLVTTSQEGLRHHSEISDGQRIGRLGRVAFRHGQRAVDEALEQGVCKYYVFNNGRLDQVAKALASVPCLTVTRSNPQNLELMPQGVDKGSGIRELTRRLGIPLKNVMAFGDEDNDLPILTQVGFGVAMGNAPEHVKNACRYVTAPFDEDGVGQAVIRYAL